VYALVPQDLKYVVKVYTTTLIIHPYQRSGDIVMQSVHFHRIIWIPKGNQSNSNFIQVFLDQSSCLALFFRSKVKPTFTINRKSVFVQTIKLKLHTGLPCKVLALDCFSGQRSSSPLL